MEFEIKVEATNPKSKFLTSFNHSINNIKVAG